MGYVEDTLMGDEKVLFKAEVSWWSQIATIIAGILLLPFYGIGLILLIKAFLTVKTTELAFTDKRVVAKVGFISRSTIELKIDKVESLQVDQGLFGRLLNFGSLVVSGAGNPQAPIPGVKSPLKFRNAFMELQQSLS